MRPVCFPVGSDLGRALAAPGPLSSTQPRVQKARLSSWAAELEGWGNWVWLENTALPSWGPSAAGESLLALENPLPEAPADIRAGQGAALSPAGSRSRKHIPKRGPADVPA